jgi:hypothetical protein
MDLFLCWALWIAAALLRGIDLVESSLELQMNWKCLEKNMTDSYNSRIMIRINSLFYIFILVG